MKAKNLLWGLILILTGVLFILRNLDMIYLNWHNVAQVWPAIFILWGISLLPVKEYLKMILIVVTLGISTWVIVDSSNINNDDSWWEYSDEESDYSDATQHFAIPWEDTVSEARLQLDAVAGSFVINSSTDSLLIFSKKGRKTTYDYIVSNIDGTAEIQINHRNRTVHLGHNNDKIFMRLNKKPVWDIDLDAGAASVKYDLRDFKVHSLNIDAGAASFDIKLGNLYPETDVTIDAGASSFNISIPESAGCELEISSVFSDKSLPGFDKLRSGYYKTPNYDTAQQKIHINIDAAVSSYNIKRYADVSQ